MPRKVFVAGEILTAADVNTNLMDQSVMVFDNAAARTTAIPAPVEGMVTYLKDTDAVEKFTGAAFVNVNTDSGKILQVVDVRFSTLISGSASGGVYNDVSGFNVSITPSSASSKVLVFASIFTAQRDGFSPALNRLVRNSTVLQLNGGRVASQAGAGANNDSYVFLDSPATTSSVNYKIQVGQDTDGGVAAFFVNRSSSSSEVRGPSTITALEVAG